MPSTFRKFARRLVGLSFLVAVPAFAVGCGGDDATSSATVSAISFDSTDCAFSETGQTKNFKGYATAPDGTRKEITTDSNAKWESKATSVVTVSNGTVVAVSTGTAEVWLSYQGATNSLRCNVTP